MVDEFANMLDEALSGAQYVRASNESYGQFVSPLLVGMLNLIQDHEISELEHAVTSTQSLADSLRLMAKNVDMTDAAAANRLRGTR
jgi:hypothetical protein